MSLYASSRFSLCLHIQTSLFARTYLLCLFGFAPRWYKTPESYKVFLNVFLVIGTVLGHLQLRSLFDTDIFTNKTVVSFKIIIYPFSCFFVFADGPSFSATVHKSHVHFFIWVHCLADRVWHRGCCYNCAQCANGHNLSESAQSSQAQHVPGDQSGSCWYVCWRPFDLWWLVFGKRL